jgi:hypothetical protein
VRTIIRVNLSLTTFCQKYSFLIRARQRIKLAPLPGILVELANSLVLSIVCFVVLQFPVIFPNFSTVSRSELRLESEKTGFWKICV